MFSAKNYGLPKDLIEAAKRVHEKQLMEYDEDGYIKNPPKGMDKGTEKTREYAAKLGLKGPHLEGEGKLPKKQKLPPLPVRKPKNEEVQFTEEELAEAFAIFLEENFHVDMLTEEDLDYVFENEFPQWLEENRTWDQWRRGLTKYQAAVEDEFKGSESPLEKSGRNILGARMRKIGPTNKTTTNGIVETHHLYLNHVYLIQKCLEIIHKGEI